MKLNTKEKHLFDLLYNKKASEAEALAFYEIFKSKISSNFCYIDESLEYPKYITMFCEENNYNLLLSKLIDNSENFNYSNHYGSTILHELIDNKKWNLVEKVLKKELLIKDSDKIINSSRDYYFDTALVNLIKSEQEELAILAVKAGANYKYNCDETSFGNIEKEALNRNMFKLINAIDEQKDIKLINEKENSSMGKVLENIKNIKNSLFNKESKNTSVASFTKK